MSIKYRFTIIYKDSKAARLVPGTISNAEIYAMFKADLDTLEVDQPREDSVFLDEKGAISFTFMRYEDGSDNHVRLFLRSTSVSLVKLLW